jgi:hypothetical protein
MERVLLVCWAGLLLLPLVTLPAAWWSSRAVPGRKLLWRGVLLAYVQWALLFLQLVTLFWTVD